MTEKLLKIAGEFVLEGTISEITPLGQGFINDTFIIHTEGEMDDALRRTQEAIAQSLSEVEETRNKFNALAAAQAKRNEAADEN